MTAPFTDAELAAYLDELLAPEAMAEIERQARGDAALVARLSEVSARRDAGLHSLGEIWRRHRLSCPTRQQWGNYLLGTLAAERAKYFEFHVQVVGCRLCQANLADLKAQQSAEPAISDQRRRKYFQSSAGQLRAKSRG
jgi:hypothetical protein